MPTRLATPVLTVDTAKMHKVDTRNVENLFGMWTVFSKCAESMEDGRRLENLSWRLWNRETFCCAPERRLAQRALATSSSSSSSRSPAPPKKSSDDVPALSASVESVATDGDSDDSSRGRRAESDSAPLEIVRPGRREDADDTRSRGREKHLTSLDLEKMVITIKERKELGPLPPSRTASSVAANVAPIISSASSAPPSAPQATDITPRPSSPTIVSTAPSTAPVSTTDSISPNGSSDTSAGSVLSAHSIVHGFEPGHVCSYRSQSHLAPAPAARPQVAPTSRADKKKNTVFMLGGSSGEEESSLEEHMQPFQPGRSSLSDGIKNKKQTSFKDEVSTRTIDDSVAVSQAAEVFSDDDEVDDDDEDIVSESAIDDEEDSSEWEDSITESGRSSVEEQPLFQRVDSKPNLTSRRSLLTSMMHQDQRAAALANAASRSTPAMQRRSRTSSPNGPSLAASPEEDETSDEDGGALHMRGPDVPRSKPIIMTTSNTHPPALSPRTTRRNMLATELTESLRRHLLWERQQKNATATAVLKRRHTAQDVTRLSAYPGQVVQQQQQQHQQPQPQQQQRPDSSKNNSWNVFDASGEYHTRGW